MSLGLSLPPPKVSVLLVLVFLAFGVLVGRATRSQPPDALVASRQPQLKLVLPAAAAPAAGTSTPSPPSSSADGEVPESQPEATPSSAAAKTPTKQAEAKAPSSAATKPSGESSESSEGGSSEATADAPAKKLPAIKHVFVIMLSDEPYATVFGPASPATYLAHTLERHGELLVHYDAVAHEELANEIALLSGQGPTAETAANCATYTDIAPATIEASEQVLGDGCVYPAATQTLAGQLAAKHLTWRAYVEGIDEAGAQMGSCAHPVLGQPDPTSAQSASTGAYATFRNPFVYFQSVTEAPACAADDVGLDRLKADLGGAKSTPSFSYIVPDRCHDGNPTPCAAGSAAGLAPADVFLRKVVPEITASKAYKESGLLVITVDEAPSTGELADSSSCCGQPRFPNLTAATTTLTPRGGGTVGALLLSPYVQAATTNEEPYNHFSLLRTIEDLFGLGHLGYAALPSVKPLEPSLFTAAKH